MWLADAPLPAFLWSEDTMRYPNLRITRCMCLPLASDFSCTECLPVTPLIRLPTSQFKLNWSACWLQRGAAKVIAGSLRHADGEGERGEGDRIERCSRAPVADPRHVARRPFTVSIGRNNSLWCGLSSSPRSSSGVAQTGFRPAEKHGKASDQASQVCARYRCAY